MDIKDVKIGGRVSFRNGIGGDDTGTVTKIGRKYITVELDNVVYGGSCRNMLGTFTTETQLFAESLSPIET
jgi:hypothetical protein